MHDQRRGNASLVVEVLIAAQRRVGKRGPRLPLEDDGLRRAGHVAFESAIGAALGVGPVVGEEKDQRVVQHLASRRASTKRPTARSMCDTTAA